MPTDEKVLNISDKSKVKNDFETFEKFFLRPFKYNGKEVTLTMKILADTKGLLRADLSKLFKLTPGDTLFATVQVAEKAEDVSKPNKAKKASLYADKSAADWLENIKQDCIVTAKVRLIYASNKEVSGYRENSVVEEVNYSKLLLLEVISN